jgi:hypothetical protein
LPDTRDPEERRELLAGRYRVDGLLGRGGMSEVYHGYGERLDRRIAIKVLRPPAAVPAQPDSAEAGEIVDALDRDRKRFMREIRVTARLEAARQDVAESLVVFGHQNPHVPESTLLPPDIAASLALARLTADLGNPQPQVYRISVKKS